MPAAQDIAQDALEKLGVYAPGEAISTDDANRALSVLNLLVDEWLGERIPLYRKSGVSFTMVTGQWAYTIGNTTQANIVANRPERILEGVGQASVTVLGATAPVDVISAVEWDAFYGSPTNPDFKGLPDRLSYDPDHPMGLVRFAPTPDQAYVATFSVFSPLTSFVDLATVYALSPETDSALRYNLAAALKPYFQTANLPQEVAVLASHTKMHLRYLYRQSRAAIRPDARRAAPAAAPAPAPVPAS